jgi:hypothetical protein
LHDELGNERCIAERLPSAGVEDLVIVPLVVTALAISKLLKAMLSILIHFLDYTFPILLQLMRIPLLTARSIGDGMELLFEGVVRPAGVQCEARNGAHECTSSGPGSGAISVTRPSSTRSTAHLRPEWRGCSENVEG